MKNGSKITAKSHAPVINNLLTRGEQALENVTTLAA